MQGVVKFLSCLAAAHASGYVSSPESLSSLAFSHSPVGQHIIETLDNELRTMEQHASHVAPSLSDTHEKVDPRYDPSGAFRLGLQIATSWGSTVFEIQDHSEDVVKYQVDCTGRMYHTLTRDFHFLKILENTGIAPRARVLSGERRVDNKGTCRALKFHMRPEDWEYCTKNAAPPVRCMIMQKMGSSVHELISKEGRLSILQSFMLGISLLQTLGKLHDLGYIHGDIHQGNVLLAEGSDISKGVVLIDFEFAEKLDTADVAARTPPEYAHSMHSPWALTGSPPSFRDDLYRAMEVVAHAIAGPGLYRTMEDSAVMLPRAEFHAIKSSFSIFDLATRRAPIGPVAKHSLDLITKYVMQLRLHERVDFKSIEAMLPGICQTARDEAQIL
jgi:serine/threonine protein kinase